MWQGMRANYDAVPLGARGGDRFRRGRAHDSPCDPPCSMYAPDNRMGRASNRAANDVAAAAARCAAHTPSWTPGRGASASASVGQQSCHGITGQEDRETLARQPYIVHPSRTRNTRESAPTAAHRGHPRATPASHATSSLCQNAGAAMRCPVCGGPLRRAHAADVMAILSAQALHGRVMHCASCGFVGCVGAAPPCRERDTHTASVSNDDGMDCDVNHTNTSGNHNNCCNNKPNVCENRCTNIHDPAEAMTAADGVCGCQRGTPSPALPPSASAGCAAGVRARNATPSRSPPCRRRRGGGVRGATTAALIGPRFGRKVFITDDDYLERRCRSMAAWEQAGVVCRIGPRAHADACAPLPLKTPRWRTVTPVPC